MTDLPKKLAKGSWPPKNSLNTSSGLRNVKVNPGKSEENSALEEPEKQVVGVRGMSSSKESEVVGERVEGGQRYGATT